MPVRHGPRLPPNRAAARSARRRGARPDDGVGSFAPATPHPDARSVASVAGATNLGPSGSPVVEDTDAPITGPERGDLRTLECHGGKVAMSRGFATTALGLRSPPLGRA